jgi:hypothetical protein
MSVWTSLADAILDFGFWVALIWICFELYRKYRFQSLPWLGAYCVIITVHKIVGTLAVHAHPPQKVTPEMARIVFSVWEIISPLCDWLMAAMILSEIALVISKVHGESSSRLISFLLRVHRNIWILGGVLLLLALSSFAFAFWIIALKP